MMFSDTRRAHQIMSADAGTRLPQKCILSAACEGVVPHLCARVGDGAQ